MATLDNANYIKALKSRPLKDVKMAVSERREAYLGQDKRCAKCKKDLRPYYYKFVKDPATKKFTAVCLDCAIKVVKR